METFTPPEDIIASEFTLVFDQKDSISVSDLIDFFEFVEVIQYIVSTDKLSTPAIDGLVTRVLNENITDFNIRKESFICDAMTEVYSHVYWGNKDRVYQDLAENYKQSGGVESVKLLYKLVQELIKENYFYNSAHSLQAKIHISGFMNSENVIGYLTSDQRIDFAVIESISFNSPLKIKFKRISYALVLAAIISGGEVDILGQSAKLNSLADTLIKLKREFFPVPTVKANEEKTASPKSN